MISSEYEPGQGQSHRSLQNGSHWEDYSEQEMHWQKSAQGSKVTTMVRK